MTEDAFMEPVEAELAAARFALTSFAFMLFEALDEANLAFFWLELLAIAKLAFLLEAFDLASLDFFMLETLALVS